MSSFDFLPRRASRARSILWLILTAGLLQFLLQACSTADSTPVGAGVNAVSAEDCGKLENVKLPLPEKKVSVVFDRTGSSATSDLPEGVLEVLREAQVAGEAAVLIPVGGASDVSRIVRTIILDPYPKVDSPAADKARQATLNCIALWASVPEMAPKSPGSDILEAISVAARSKPEKIIVVSDGVNTSGAFDINEIGFDATPGDVAARLKHDKAFEPALQDRTVVWAGLGDTNPKLNQTFRNDLQELWTALLHEAGAKVDFDSKPGTGTRQEPAAGLPADPYTTPQAQSNPVGCAIRVTIPNALLFTGNSSQLGEDASQPLTEAADVMKQHMDWGADIAGNAAAYGDVDGQLMISQQRADAVKSALVDLGVNESRLAAKGYGASRPIAAEFSQGSHDAAAAARNRRVEITMKPKGCLS